MKIPKNILTAAKSINADVEIWADSENSYTIEATAPDGMEWIESGGVSLVSRFWTYDKQSKIDAINDILNRINIGLQNENL